MIRGALFDIDDTLYSHKLKTVPKQTMKLLDKLRAQGIRIGICTSRVGAELASVPDELLERVDCKIFTTGAVTMIDDKYFKSYTIDKAKAREYVKYFDEKHISYHYTDLNGDLFYWGDLDKVNNGDYLSFALGNVRFKPYEDDDITCLFYYEAADEEVKYIDQIDPDILISKWGNSGNICPSLVDKSFGLLKFCQVFSLTTDEVVAAGDGINDDVMLKMAGIGIAVSNAKENTLEAADYICKKPIEEGGLYDAFVELGIIKEDEYDIRMFVFDNDSTLFDHSIHKIRDKTYAALRKLKEKGKLLVLNTSRSLPETYNIPKDLMEMMDVIILLSGAYVIYKDHVDITCIDKKLSNRLIAYMDQEGLVYRYVTDKGEGYLNYHNPQREELFDRLYGMIPPVKAYEGETIIHLLYYAQGEVMEKILELCGNLERATWSGAGEISPEGKNKGTAMIEAGRNLGIAAKNICAFGDGGNDLQMLKMAGLGIAMGNGSQACREAADYVTEDISDEGIYKALKHFGFIEGD